MIITIYFFQDGSIHRLFIQPSDRRRTNQLQYIKTRLERGDDANRVSLFYVMTRARLRSIEEVESEDSGRYSVVNCVGLTDVALTRSVSEIGSGSPDSHVVKEIDANAPVVSVTLGGVGQGAYDTKPTFDPSPLSRLPYSTRRGFSCTASSIRIDLGGTPIQFIEVTPLNNNSDDLKNWGTYPFPKVGRIYLKDGASAEYTSKTGVSFHFSDNADLSKKLFTLADGSSVATFKEWSIQTGLCSAASTVTGSNNGTFDLGDTIMGDGFFFIENASTDGTTVNDRLFQSMDNVTHDYQLGSQFASTRALVEIPLFKEQIFEDAVKNIYPSPDNSLKLHLDATLTPHTWNPSPVGRRYPSQPPADRSAYSSNASSKLKNKNQKHTKIKGWEHIPSEVVRTATAGTTDITVGQEIKATSSSGNGVGMIIKVITVSSGDIDSAEVINTGLGYAVGDTVVFTANGGGNNTLKIHVLGHYRIYPSNPKMFPAAVTTGASYYSATDILIHRQAFLSTGDWMIYSNTPSDDNYLKIDDNTSNYSIDLFSNMVAGMQIILGGDYQSEVLLPLTGDPVTPSAVNEFRREYHHDAASALTQGGNVDYGLRQYVSAVEFKAGPTANPHIPKIQSGRAKGTVLAVNAFSNTGLASIVLSREDLEKFPKIKPNLQDGTTLVYDIGDYHYTIEVTDPSGTSHRLIYLGESDDFALPYLTGSPSSRKHSSSILVQTVDITHTGIPTIFDKTNAAYIAGQEIKLAKRGFDVEFTDGDKTLADLQTNLNLSNSGRVRHAQYHWEVLELGAAAKKTLKVQIGQINSASSSGWRRLLQANSLEVSVNLGDHVYAEVSTYTGATPTNQCYYLGEVIKVYEGILEEGKGINAKSSETIIELKEEIPSATITALNSDISSITTLANGSAPANKYAHIYLRVGCHSIMKNDDDAILNRTWLYPYAGGGLRHGDTVWANMTYNNPHAMQGMFAKSRGVFNEALVWEEFNDGEGILNNQPRDSIPIENFLIGNTCLETAQNYAQHVNKTIELNYTNLGLDNPLLLLMLTPTYVVKNMLVFYFMM